MGEKINRFDLYCILAFMLIGLFFSYNEANAGKSYYLSPYGSDKNNGLINSPWSTISHALRKSGPGDTVYLRGGIYNERVEIRGHEGMGGSNGNFWTLQAYSGETATVRGDIVLYMASYVRIKGLRVENGTINNNSWVRTGYSFPHHNEILNNTVTGTQQRYNMIGVIGDDNLVEGNVIIITGGGGSLDHGIYVMSGSRNVIRGNYISGAQGFGIHIYDEVKNDRSGKIDSLTVEGNKITSSTSGGIIVASGASTNDNVASNIMIRNNIVIVNTGGRRGIEVRQNAKNIFIYNNTIYRNSSGDGMHIGVCCGSDGYIEGVTVKNNIINKDGSSGYHVRRGNSGAVSNIVLDNNLYWPEPLNLSNILDKNPITAKPLFVNQHVDDFHLQQGSPAIDKGATLTEVLFDKDGIKRPVGTAYDIGTYEFR